jgi:hypothetical protein
MKFPKKERANVVKKIELNINMDEPSGTLVAKDPEGKVLWQDTLENTRRFVGCTVAQMLAQLAADQSLQGGEVADFLISNLKHCDTSYDQNLADNGIFEEIDPLRYRPVESDTVIDSLDTISALFVFYAARNVAAEENETSPVETEEIERDQSCSFNPFTHRFETYQEWMERQNYIPPGQQS